MRMIVCVGMLALTGCGMYVSRAEFEKQQQELRQVFASMGVREDRTMYWTGAVPDQKQAAKTPASPPAEPPKK